jgi:dethiobiotin synthetase
MAPHIAAERAGVRISMAALLDAYGHLRGRADAVVVEGVGGFCVPLGDGFGTADLARALGLPVVLVVGLRLGCLNHAALTVEAIAARGLHLAGWVANTVDPHMAQIDRNFLALQQSIPAPCMGRIPWLTAGTTETAVRWLDLHVLAQEQHRSGQSGRT